MLDCGGGALQAIVYAKNNVTLIKNVLLRKRRGNIIFIANGGSKKNICHVFSDLNCLYIKYKRNTKSPNKTRKMERYNKNPA